MEQKFIEGEFKDCSNRAINSDRDEILKKNSSEMKNYSNGFNQMKGLVNNKLPLQIDLKLESKIYNGKTINTSKLNTPSKSFKVIDQQIVRSINQEEISHK